MPLYPETKRKFNDLKLILKNKDKHSIKIEAHGGNCILFIYPPKQERIYLEKIKSDYPEAHFIDIASLFVEYIDSIGLRDFVDIYEEYSSEPEKLFKSDSSNTDFFNLILKEIKTAGVKNKIPIIIRAGALHGTSIENINIMDSNIVQNLSNPLVILYPATTGSDNKLRFLNFKLASDYRAILID